MQTLQAIDRIYIGGELVEPHGTELFDLVNPTTNQLIGRVRLGDEEDARRAIAAAKKAFRTYRSSTVAERIGHLEALRDAVAARMDDLIAAAVTEYGSPLSRARLFTPMAANAFGTMIQTLETYAFERQAGSSTVTMEPVGVAALITPWNANAGSICNKLATALAAGCTAVIKPSELSATQTQILLEAFHAAGLPAGLVNVVNGRGEVVGAELTRHPDVAKISFTGSTVVGKTIARGAAETLKRLMLELGGKSPNLVLPDADFATAIPAAVMACYMNNGQACVAGTRLLVPEARLDEVKALAKAAAERVRVGDPADDATELGPMVTRKQYERVQGYIQLGLDEGAELVTGGLRQPEGLEAGNFVRPTVFAGVTNGMRIAREEIFGPVLSILTYRDEEEAVAIANDTPYGLQAYVSSTDLDHARRVASRLEAGRVVINHAPHDPLAPFGGFKQSGLGREYGSFGLDAYLEPKALRV